MAVEGEVYCAEVAKAYNALPEDKKKGSIGFVTMPAKWQPAQIPAVEKMYQHLIASTDKGGLGIPESAFALSGVEKRAQQEEYSGKPVGAGTYIWPSLDVTSKKLESKYFESNENLQLLISTLAYTFINPGLDSANKLTSMKVWTTGYDTQPALIDNFGTKGNKTYQGVRTAPIECVAMPLIEILDKINGKSFADKEAAMAEFAQITDQNKFKLKNLQIKPSSTIVIINDEQMDAYLNHNVYGTAKGADSMIDAAALKQLMVTYNPNATFEGLLKAFSGKDSVLTIDAVLKKAGK
jgi:hypothetical protein